MKKLILALTAIFILSGCSSSGIVSEDPLFILGQPPTDQEMIGHIYTSVEPMNKEEPLG